MFIVSFFWGTGFVKFQFLNRSGYIPENKTLQHYQEEVSLRSLVPIDETFPFYIQMHQEELIEQGYVPGQLHEEFPMYSPLKVSIDTQDSMQQPFFSY